MSTTNTYYVVMTTSPWGNRRTSAVRGLKFETQEAAKAHIPKLPAYLAQTAFVEPRTQKVKAEGYQMTCQCCARQIFAETGTIAHHGYERPGDGWQTASCMGAKYLPFEVSRERLGHQIMALEDRLDRAMEARREVAAEKVAVSYKKTNYNAKPAVERGYGGRREYPTVTLEFTRENFAQLLVENTGPRDDGKLWGSYDVLQMEKKGFDGVKADDLDRRDAGIANIREHLKECQDRYNAWKQTHKRVGDNWVRV